VTVCETSQVDRKREHIETCSPVDGLAKVSRKLSLHKWMRKLPQQNGMYCSSCFNAATALQLLPCKVRTIQQFEVLRWSSTQGLIIKTYIKNFNILFCYIWPLHVSIYRIVIRWYSWIYLLVVIELTELQSLPSIVSTTPQAHRIKPTWRPHKAEHQYTRKRGPSYANCNTTWVSTYI
jgi:hypothetical protein